MSIGIHEQHGARWFPCCICRQWRASCGYTLEPSRDIDAVAVDIALIRDYITDINPDAYVTAHLLREILKQTTMEKLIRWSNEPVLLARMPFPTGFFSNVSAA
jgi:hypothetical protein